MHCPYANISPEWTKLLLLTVLLADVLPHLTTPWFMNANRFDVFGALLAESGSAVGNDKFDYLWPFNVSLC